MGLLKLKALRLPPAAALALLPMGGGSVAGATGRMRPAAAAAAAAGPLGASSALVRMAWTAGLSAPSVPLYLILGTEYCLRGGMRDREGYAWEMALSLMITARQWCLPASKPVA